MAKKARRRATREPMSRVDTAWLRMERGTNPMMITGVLMFAEPMSLKALKQVVKHRFLEYARFRQKPVEGLRLLYRITNNRHTTPLLERQPQPLDQGFRLLGQPDQRHGSPLRSSQGNNPTSGR